MTFKHRILLDRWLAVPFSVACNAFVRLLGKILRRDHSTNPANTRQIVVSKLVGMGSIIHATPLLRALKQQFPQAQLTFVTLKGNRGLVERLENVDEILCLDDSGVWPMLGSTLSLLINLVRRRIDHYFDLEVYSGFACLLSLFSLARNRFGFYRHSDKFKRGIYTHLIYFNTRMPVRRIYLQLGWVAGVPAEAGDSLGKIQIEPSERVSLQEKLEGLGLKPGSRYILVNPNASDLLIERRWPENQVATAITRLAEMEHNVVLMGSRVEASFVTGIAERVPGAVRNRIFNTAGLLTLGEAFTLIEQAACVLTNDTGPMHMAFALSSPTVCLFGPADPVHYGLNQPNIVTLYAPVPCSPCIYEVDEPPCRGDNICMQRLAPELVVEQVLGLLRDHEKAASVTRLPLIWHTESGQPLGMVQR